MALPLGGGDVTVDTMSSGVVTVGPPYKSAGS